MGRSAAATGGSGALQRISEYPSRNLKAAVASRLPDLLEVDPLVQLIPVCRAL
jgi:hypothetical protein